MEMLEWDARSYDALPLPHKHWGATAIAQLRLNGNETVLDLGCGPQRRGPALAARPRCGFP
jgi:trans-aconitate 2-methyltransferase